jgi:predicted transport protein
MSDIKLFKVEGGGVRELPGRAVAVERDLQALIERNLDTVLGVRLLASEYSTGKTHGGRIDTLGIDENNAPVIVEYKRSTNENVINQGLYYLDWLLDHRAEFTLLVMKQFGSEAADAVEWSSPRLLCIAGDFNRYDEHAVQQINRSIELMRYRSYDAGFLVLELVNATGGAGEAVTATKVAAGKSPRAATTVTEHYNNATPELRNVFDELDRHLRTLGDDVTTKTLKLYFAYRRIKNFVCVEVHPQSNRLLVYLKVDPDSVRLEEGFSRDVRKIGHFGTGDLEVRIASGDDVERAAHLFKRSYDAS